MKRFAANIPLGIGDLIYLKAMFEPVKDQYKEIRFGFHRDLIVKYNKDPSYNDFINELGELLFGEPPYVIKDGYYPYQRLEHISTSHRLHPRKPDLAHLLCKGTPLNLDKPYIVINTKVRQVPKKLLEDNISEFWNILNTLSDKYTIVILGEREIEMNKEYQVYTSEYIFSLHDYITNNIPSDRLLDLTVPALGITAPNMQNMQQDCLIMNQAELVINIGIGGGFCLATAVANVVAFRYDDDYIADMVYNKTYPNAVVTKEWNVFIQALRKYL